MASVREPTDSQMHLSIQEMIDRYGVTPACREFLEEEQQQFINGRFSAGQVCSAGSRLYVQRGLYDRVLEETVKLLRREPSVFFGGEPTCHDARQRPG